MSKIKGNVYVTLPPLLLFLFLQVPCILTKNMSLKHEREIDTHHYSHTTTITNIAANNTISLSNSSLH